MDNRDQLAMNAVRDYFDGNQVGLTKEDAFRVAFLWYLDDQKGSGMGKARIERRLCRKDAVKYMVWVKAGLIEDKHPRVTVTKAFSGASASDPEYKTLHGKTGKWLKNSSLRPPDPHEEKQKRQGGPFTPEQLIKEFMLASGRRYQASLRSND